jgi:Subtilase family
MPKRWASLRVVVTALLAAPIVLVTAAPAHADHIRDDQWHLAAMNIAQAQERSKGDGVVVAVVGAGVDATHPDIAKNVLSPAAVDGDTDSARFDPDGTGTGLAGAIAGHGHGANGENGVLGVAPVASVLPVVVRPSAPGTELTADQLADGIDLATKRGVKVICVGRMVAASEKLRLAVAAARKADIVVVAADGDRSGETFSPFPAAYEGVLAAVPLTRQGEVAVQSTSGRNLGFGVPGEQILTTNSGGGYRIDDGLASAGLLAGAVALVRAAYPQLSADEIVHRLSVTANRGGRGAPDTESGRGTLDLVAALTRTVPLLRPPVTAAPSVAASGSTRPTPSSSAAAAPVEPTPPRGPLGWLIVLPLVAVVAILIWYALRAERNTEPARARSTRTG